MRLPLLAGKLTGWIQGVSLRDIGLLLVGVALGCFMWVMFGLITYWTGTLGLLVFNGWILALVIALWFNRDRDVRGLLLGLTVTCVYADVDLWILGLDGLFATWWLEGLGGG